MEGANFENEQVTFFEFNKIYILESLGKSDIKTDRRLHEDFISFKNWKYLNCDLAFLKFLTRKSFSVN